MTAKERIQKILNEEIDVEGNDHEATDRIYDEVVKPLEDEAGKLTYNDKVIRLKRKDGLWYHHKEITELQAKLDGLLKDAKD